MVFNDFGVSITFTALSAKLCMCLSNRFLIKKKNSVKKLTLVVMSMNKTTCEFLCFIYEPSYYPLQIYSNNDH